MGLGYTLSEYAQLHPLAMLNVQDIILTDEQKDLIVRKAIEQALGQLYVAENEHRASQKRKLTEKPAVLDAAGVWKRVLATINQNDPVLDQVGGWKMDEQAKGLFELLCLYHARDERFEQRGAGFSRAKGMVLAGRIGVGKTTLLTAFRGANPASHPAYGVVTAEYLVALYTHKKTGGKEALTPYLTGSWLIDDVGRELVFDERTGEVKLPQHYGTPVNVITYIIEQRYSRGLPFSSLHLTLNLSLGDFRRHYGPRAYSRLSQTMNVLEFQTEALDRRTGLPAETV